MTTYISNVRGRWYAFRGDAQMGRVWAIGNDRPLTVDANYVGDWTAAGVRFACKPCPSRSAAYQKARRHGDYAGELRLEAR